MAENSDGGPARPVTAWERHTCGTASHRPGKAVGGRAHPFTSAVLLLLVCILPGCQSEPSAPVSAPVAIEQWTGQLGGKASPEVQVARSAAEWDALWKPMGTRPPRPLKEGSEMAVAVFVGARSMGGFRVQPVSVEPQGDRTIVRYRETKPVRGRLYTQAPTSPWAIVMAPVSSASAVAINVDTGEQMTPAK